MSAHDIGQAGIWDSVHWVTDASLEAKAAFGVVLVTLIQAFILIWQARISSTMKRLEQERRAEEGAVVGWSRLRDDDTRGENSMTRGKMYQLAAWNKGARAQLIWDAEIQVVRSPKDGQYPAEFGAHGSSKFLDRSWRISAKSADRLQVFMDASLEDIPLLEAGWMFLRFRTPDGPDYVLLSTGEGGEPGRSEVLRDWISQS